MTAEDFAAGNTGNKRVIDDFQVAGHVKRVDHGDAFNA